MSVLQERQFGKSAPGRKYHASPRPSRIPPRTLYGDIIDARGMVQASGHETPDWLLNKK